jgi:hypothetical protein
VTQLTINNANVSALSQWGAGIGTGRFSSADAGTSCLAITIGSANLTVESVAGNAIGPGQGPREVAVPNKIAVILNGHMNATLTSGTSQAISGGSIDVRGSFLIVRTNLQHVFQVPAPSPGPAAGDRFVFSYARTATALSEGITSIPAIAIGNLSIPLDDVWAVSFHRSDTGGNVNPVFLFDSSVYHACFVSVDGHSEYSGRAETLNGTLPGWFVADTDHSTVFKVPDSPAFIPSVTMIPYATPTPEPTKLSSGDVIGIVIGVLVVAIIVVGLICYCRKKGFSRASLGHDLMSDPGAYKG